MFQPRGEPVASFLDTIERKGSVYNINYPRSGNYRVLCLMAMCLAKPECIWMSASQSIPNLDAV